MRDIKTQICDIVLSHLRTHFDEIKISEEIYKIVDTNMKKNIQYYNINGKTPNLDTPPLGTWIKLQRRMYKNAIKDNLQLEHERLLNELPWWKWSLKN